MAKFDLEWLLVFDGIFKTRSVSRTAEHLGLAQATVSVALNKLRLHFNDKLFIRTSQGMEPTPRAQALYPQLASVLETLELARDAPTEFVPLEARRAFRLCITDISEIVILPRLMNHLRQVAPKVSIVAEKITPESPKHLESGEVDMAIGFMPHLEAGFYQKTLFTQNFVCLAAKNHPRVGLKLTKEAFLSEMHIQVTTSGTGHSIVDKTLAMHGVHREVVLHLSSFLGVARVVAQTELLVIVPKMLGITMQMQEQVRILDVPFDLPSYAVKQHWHDRFHADPGNIWLRRTIAELFRDFAT
ncbi:LysR family transcriptional regulator [Noviherbaspirillum malthae]|jgi:DNA-binding transcriptional LysR family regulator|uniref:LysR family transcriptional regulator n=1 Tax=Noviherbaspirillum malthae TaxID=1260987 RepID=UPI00189003ED|nr:LysR family transcriptional regulator [Noviherbaspirillum malthae]